MARIRTIKPEFWTSEQVMECSPTARLLFIGLWNFCDDGGNHSANARRLKAEVFPGDDITIAEINKLMDELIDHDLVVRYMVNGNIYWHVTGWHHQRIDKKTIKYPEFHENLIFLTDDLATIRQPVSDQSPNDRRTVADQSSNSRIPFDPVMECNGEEKEKTSSLLLKLPKNSKSMAETSISSENPENPAETAGNSGLEGAIRPQTDGVSIHGLRSVSDMLGKIVQSDGNSLATKLPNAPDAIVDQSPNDRRTVADQSSNGSENKPSRAVEITVLLRKNRVRPMSASHPLVVEWAQNPRITDQLLSDALQVAADYKPQGNISPNYLKPIIDGLLDPPDLSRQRDSPKWYESASGIEQKGREIGISALPGESFPDFKRRIFEKMKKLEQEGTAA